MRKRRRDRRGGDGSWIAELIGDLVGAVIEALWPW
jgi:hypothetical protein